MKINSYNDFIKYVEKLKINIEGDFVEMEWATGGMSGGNCYGDEASPWVNSDPIPEFEDLDKILEHVCPDISFLQYKRICSDLIEEASRSSGEWYGNGTNYKIKKCNLKNLYEALVERNLIEQSH